MQFPIRTLVIALSLTAAACSFPQPMSDSEFATNAQPRALKAVPNGAPARIVAISANGVLERACGWMVIAGRSDSVLFKVDQLDGEPGNIIDIADIVSGSMTERIASEFNLELDLMDCERAHALPAIPQNASIDPISHQRLRELWNDAGPRWAIIHAPGATGFVGVSRRTGGGQIITPLFASEHEVQAWIDDGGNTKADGENAKGKAGMASEGICLSKAHTNEDINRCSSPAMDLTVQLQ